jgi:hypothetical protein
MTCRAGVLMVAAAALAAGQEPPASAPPRVARSAVEALERSFDVRVRKVSIADPMELMNCAQAVYLEGFGLVLTAQVDLILTPSPSPFVKLSKTDIERIRARKADHLPLLRQVMQQIMLEAATALSALPPHENIAIAVSLFRMNWENSGGLPSQIVMRAPRHKLLERVLAQNAIDVREY